MARLWTPGSPKTWRTPSARRASTTHSPPVRSSLIAHFRPGLLEPEPHVHFAEHHGRGREVLVCLLPVAHAAVEMAEAKMALCLERAHAALDGESHCRLEMLLCLR